ncbi:MAG TPA: DUF551 domain-containing protein [Ignavibacteria bacterium]|nr:DUF551 domain-containing protein [Ignavibacteria bacterium]
MKGDTKMVDYPKNHSELYWRTIKNDPPPFTQDEGNDEHWTDMVLFFNGYAIRPGYIKKDNICGISIYDENDKYIKATHWMPLPCPPVS